MKAMNPLLDFSGLPRFAEIQPEHVTPAVDAAARREPRAVERVAAERAAPTWDALRRAAGDANERLGARLGRRWGT